MASTYDQSNRKVPSSNGKPGLLRRWTDFLVNRPKQVLIGGLIIVVLYIIGAVALSGQFADRFELPGSESQQAYDLLNERFPQQAGSTAQIVFKTEADGGIANPEIQSEIDAFLTNAATLPHVVGVISPFDAPNQISAEGNIAYATVYYDALSTDVPIADADKLIVAIDDANSDTLTVAGGGEIVVLTEQEFGSTAEIVGLIAAAIILLIAFGSVVAMGLPIVTALLGLLIGLLGVGVVANFMNVATFAPIFASMIGIGVGIDYALFIVTRFREGLNGGMEPKEAAGRAVDTAGRAVIFAGAVVVISMLGLAIIGVEFVTSLGVSAAFVVAAAVVVALSFLPVFLVLIGKRIDKWSVRRPRASNDPNSPTFGRRLSTRIQAHPGRFALAASAFLIFLALPILDMDLGFPDAGANPSDFQSRQAYDLLAEGFGVGYSNPLILVVDDPNGIEQSTLAGAFAGGWPAGWRGAGRCSHPQSDRRHRGDHRDPLDRFEQRRDQGSGQHAAQRGHSRHARRHDDAGRIVGGPTASFLDFSDHMESRTPWVFVVIIGLSFVLLTIVFRSPVIAIKAAIMNLFSIAAAFGIVIAVFQWGWAKDLFGIEETQPIAVFLPLMMFAILFGLSMDYEVFLLSRIREFWAHGRSTSDAVADGLAVTARVITAAAAIMVSVFLSFVALPESDYQAVRTRSRGGDPDRRHHRPPRAGARHHGAARRMELVVPVVARPHHPARQHRRQDRSHPGRVRSPSRHGRLIPLLLPHAHRPGSNRPGAMCCQGQSWGQIAATSVIAPAAASAPVQITSRLIHARRRMPTPIQR